MTWFVAGIVSYIEVIAEGQSEFPVWEDFYLFEAHSKSELEQKIRKKAQAIEAAGDCNFGGKPARQRCIGVRKIRSIYNAEGRLDEDRPSDGTELTHSFLMARTRAHVAAYARGEEVELRCMDDSDDLERWSMYFGDP